MADRTSSVSDKMDKAKNWLKSRFSRDEQEILNNPSPNSVDAKLPGKVMKASDKIVVYTQNKRLNLKNSPPYLQGILLDTQDHIKLIFDKNPLELLKTSEYLRVFSAKFFLHCKKTSKLFKDAKEQMENEASEYRRQLNKYTLVFSHLLTELKEVYKGGVLLEDFVIVKQKPREFWAKFFKKRIIVPWTEFLVKFRAVHEVCSTEEANALKKTMDLVENNHISWFEFDVFTRLFQPWKNLLNNWNVIVIRHPAYQAFMTYDEVEAILDSFKHKPGSYVFRQSCTRLGQWAIGFVTPQNTIVQTIPQSKSLYQALIDGAEDGTYIYPCGTDKNPDLREQIRITPQERIKVTKEQYDLYCDIDSTFELCKICNSNLKSVRIDPCGHLICNGCLVHWMESSGRRQSTTCPFCRKPVMSTEKVMIDPFDPLADDEDDDDLEDVSPTDGISKERQRSWRKKKDSAAAAAAAAAVNSQPSGSTSNGPSSAPSGATSPAAMPVHVSPENVNRLEEMGFPREKAVKALQVARNDIAVATDILTNFPQ